MEALVLETESLQRMLANSKLAYAGRAGSELTFRGGAQMLELFTEAGGMIIHEWSASTVLSDMRFTGRMAPREADFLIKALEASLTTTASKRVKVENFFGGKDIVFTAIPEDSEPDTIYYHTDNTGPTEVPTWFDGTWGSRNNYAGMRYALPPFSYVGDDLRRINLLHPRTAPIDIAVREVQGTIYSFFTKENVRGIMLPATN